MRRLSSPFRLTQLSRAVPALSDARPARRRQTAARRTVFGFLVIFVLANIVFSMGMDRIFPSIRDPEYGRRVNRWNQRKREHPERVMTAMIGSSRMAMGLRPDVANCESGPTMFNFSMVGSGPLMQLMTLKRMLHDGVIPDRIVLEYWPPFMRGDGTYSEELRIDPHRLLTYDDEIIRNYFVRTDFIRKTMWQVRRNPFYEHRLRIISQLMPSWLPPSKRIDASWDRLDRWGWLPGFDREFQDDERRQRIEQASVFYRQLFSNYSIHATSKRALGEFVAICQERSIPLTLIWLPESSEFREAYPTEVLKESEAYLTELQEAYQLRIIDARTWVEDRYFLDGFHLTQMGARDFSTKIADVLRSTHE